MIEYHVGDVPFSLSYQELKSEHERLCELPDEDFLRSLPAALHLACITSWLKELPPIATIGDRGIVHELVHLLHEGTTRPLVEIREQFRAVLVLA